jgi:branched-chain amino acid transport system substrate-binding protein
MARSWRALLLLAPLVLASCGSDGSTPTEGSTLTVYVSLPLRGPAGGEGRDAADGARLALADAGAEAGGYEVEARFLDDTEPVRGTPRWTPAQAAANAREASHDSTAIAFVGDLESGATRASLPVTNEARMLHVSPASGAADLVAPFPGSDDVPDAQPSGERTFGRVIPSDVAQAETAAAWTARLGWPRARIVSDRSRFGKLLAASFEAEAARQGVEIGAGPEARVYLAGGPASVPSFRAGEVLDMLAAHPRGVMGSDVFLPPFGGSAFGLYTSAALDPSQLPEAGRTLVERIATQTGREAGRYTAYGYEAMAVVLDSIGRASDPADRQAVIDAFFETENRDSVLGPYSIDELGETTLGRITGYELRGGGALPVAELRVP